MDPREKNLPVWVQQLLRGLRQRLATDSQSREIEIVKLNLAQLKLRVAAMFELIECAAKGGHLEATEITKIIESYGITKDGIKGDVP